MTYPAIKNPSEKTPIGGDWIGINEAEPPTVKVLVSFRRTFTLF
jgi:hypothetical protein